MKIWFQNRRTKWKKQNPGMDVNCGTLPSPPNSLCGPYPSLFPPPPSPSELGFYSHHSAFPFIAAAAASSNHSGMFCNYYCIFYISIRNLRHFPMPTLPEFLKFMHFFPDACIFSQMHALPNA